MMQKRQEKLLAVTSAIILFSLLSVTAMGYEINTFSGGESELNITKTDGGYEIVNFSIPLYANVTDAEVGIRGQKKLTMEGTMVFDFATAGLGGATAFDFIDGYFWFADETNATAFKFHPNGTYAGQLIDYSAYATGGIWDGITGNSTWIYITDSDIGDSDVLEFYHNGTYSQTIDFDWGYGLEMEDNLLWFAQPYDGNGRFAKLWMNKTVIRDFKDPTDLALNNQPYDIGLETIYIYAVDQTQRAYFFRYKHDSYENASYWSIGTSAGIHANETHLMILYSNNGTVQIYTRPIGEPHNLTIDVGNEGSYEKTHTGYYATSETVDLNVTAIDDYLSSCSTDPCLVPINISMDTDGILEMSSLNITYTGDNAILNCSEAGAEALRFFFYRESNQTSIQGSMDITIEVLNPSENQTSSYSFSFPENESHPICIDPLWGSYRIDAQIEFDGTGYSTRSYYLTNATITSTVTDVNLYLLEDTPSEAVVVYVKDSNDNYIDGVKVYLEKYYLGSNTYKTVVIGKTDGSGEFLTYLDLEDIYYRALVYDTDDTLSNEYIPSKIPDTEDDPETLVYYLSSALPEYYQFMESASYYCTFTNATKIIRCSIVDGSGFMTQACMKVDWFRTLGRTTLYDTCDTGSSVTLTFNISNEANGTYEYKFDATLSSGSKKTLVSDYVYFAEGKQYGDTGVIAGSFLIIAMSLLGIFSPLLAVIFPIIGLAVGVQLDLIEISISSIISLIIVGIIIVFGGSRRRA